MNLQAVIQQIDQLSRIDIEARLQQIESEEKQLRVLLRLSKRQEAKQRAASFQQEAPPCQ